MGATPVHYHVAAGLVGYGPDGSNGFATALDMPALADLIRGELSRGADAEYESAHAAGDDKQYEVAWKTFLRSEHLSTLAASFDNKRADAPLYAGRPDRWAETVQRLAVEHFPQDISDSTRLHVWPCEDDGCEHYAGYLANA